MRVPLTVGDFLERAANVYGDRIAVVDEPGRPGDLGELTYTQLHNRARTMAATLDRIGIEQGDRRQASHEPGATFREQQRRRTDRAVPARAASEGREGAARW